MKKGTSGRGDLERGWRLEIAGQGEDVSLDTERGQALNEEVRKVQSETSSGSVSAGEYATNPAGGVVDHRPRVSTLRSIREGRHG